MNRRCNVIQELARSLRARHAPPRDCGRRSRSCAVHLQSRMCGSTDLWNLRNYGQRAFRSYGYAELRTCAVRLRNGRLCSDVACRRSRRCTALVLLRIYGFADLRTCGLVQPRPQGPAADLGSASGEGGLVLQSTKVACTTGRAGTQDLSRVQSAVTTPPLRTYGGGRVW